jgi:hypothetical protein
MIVPVVHPDRSMCEMKKNEIHALAWEAIAA